MYKRLSDDISTDSVATDWFTGGAGGTSNHLTPGGGGGNSSAIDALVKIGSQLGTNVVNGLLRRGAPAPVVQVQPAFPWMPVLAIGGLAVVAVVVLKKKKS